MLATVGQFAFGDTFRNEQPDIIDAYTQMLRRQSPLFAISLQQYNCLPTRAVRQGTDYIFDPAAVGG